MGSLRLRLQEARDLSEVIAQSNLRPEKPGSIPETSCWQHGRSSEGATSNRQTHQVRAGGCSSTRSRTHPGGELGLGRRVDRLPRPVDLGLGVREGFLEDGVLQSLGLARAGFWLLRASVFSPVKWGCSWQHFAEKELTGIPINVPSSLPLLISSTGTALIEEPTETTWGLEGPLLHPGQPPPALEDWEGELARAQVLALLWTAV